MLEISREDFASMAQAKGGKRPWVDAYVTHRALQTMIRRFEIVSDLNTEDARRWLAKSRIQRCRSLRLGVRFYYSA